MDDDEKVFLTCLKYTFVIGVFCMIGLAGFIIWFKMLPKQDKGWVMENTPIFGRNMHPAATHDGVMKKMGEDIEQGMGGTKKAKPKAVAASRNKNKSHKATE